MNRFTRYQPHRLPRSYEDVQMELHGAHAPDEEQARAEAFWRALPGLCRRMREDEPRREEE